MKIFARRKAVLALALLILVFATRGSAAAPVLPNPILYFLGAEYVEINGKQITRYRFDVLNKEEFPDDMFAASPALPPCGSNTKAARTWVDFYDQSGKRLNGFCALGKSADLNGIWFALDEGVVPPSWIYIEMNDRKTNTKYKSNLADTTL
ncbi:MAG TPA: hypothetical protein VN659_09415 [Pyrinomonadaceae bacterium]|jgi:hypothetical protein|nr:hypothetical protein [Pyrinomonadaceae bacterium]